MLAVIIIKNDKNALNPVFWKEEAAFSHLPGGGILGSFFQLGHLDLLHTALSESSTSFYIVEISGPQLLINGEFST